MTESIKMVALTITEELINFTRVGDIEYCDCL